MVTEGTDDEPPAYEDAKAHELAEVAIAAIARKAGIDGEDPLTAWRSQMLWVDKACIPQDNAEVKAQCIRSLERFIALSDNVVVLLSWSYFTRLWYAPCPPTRLRANVRSVERSARAQSVMSRDGFRKAPLSL
jgi:hypothetical protein